VSHSQNPYVLIVDDDPLILLTIQGLLLRGGYQAVCVPSARQALQEIQKRNPGLILLDVLMPEMDGYEFCAHLQKNSETAYIPVIFLSSLEDEQSKSKAFSVGAVDYLVKPVDGGLLVQKVQAHLQMNPRWLKLRQGTGGTAERTDLPDFKKFKEFLSRKFSLSPGREKKLISLSSSQIYSLSSEMGISNRQAAMSMADFLQLPYLPRIIPDEVSLGVLPSSFCKNYSVVPIKGNRSKPAFVLSNPFDWELIDTLRKFTRRVGPLEILVTELGSIESLFQGIGKGERHGSEGNDGFLLDPDPKEKSPSIAMTGKFHNPKEISPVHSLTDYLLEAAVTEKASDIHVEPKENEVIIRLRVDGNMNDFMTLETRKGTKLISRFKALAQMDIAERRKPQDGSMGVVIHQKTLKLRLTTTSTPNGESLIIRVLEPGKKPMSLKALGMSPEQIKLMGQLAIRNQGLILVVGPTGSGKTTTIYSLLSQIDCQTRSLISVEDPVEYRIPLANQQQVNNKGGVTFEALLKSSVRQDPDILFIGEVRDPFSAKIAMDFASTGHLTFSTLHTSNATTAIFRLERLEISRGTMADSILAIVAQRLLRKLCPFCKRTEPITPEEVAQIAPFMQEIPTHIAHPVGCDRCNQTGYSGREGIQEVIHCDANVARMIRVGDSISEIREYVFRRGDQLISHGALERVKNLTFSLEEVYEKVLVEEKRPESGPIEPQKSTIAQAIQDNRRTPPSILVVEDDLATQKMISHFLENEGYKVVVAADGIDALIKMGESRFDLILSDINIPNLDGFRLLEMVQQKGFTAPVILMTGSADQEDEIKGMELGAALYLKKPIRKELLLLQVRKILQPKKLESKVEATQPLSIL